jgi:hypothetical protein
MANVSVNNGLSTVSPEEAIKSVEWDELATMMDDETRETVHSELAPCTELEFLTRYLELAKENLVVG